jgi:phosphatidate phosphatase APP1
VVTDEEGYFGVELRPSAPAPAGWQEVQLRLLESIAGSEGIRATARVLVPGGEAEFGVISDVDDTVVRTRATNRIAMVATVLFNDAHSREPFTGVAALYRALVRGSDGHRSNPIFYVSRSGWNLYDLLDAFFAVHGVPPGPMFLRDLAMLEPKSQALGQGEDKVSRIETILETYPALPFVLIGDSGQRDPEVYEQIARAHPGRVRAVYIRDVTRTRRDREVRRIMEGLQRQGVRACAVPDSAEAAADAAQGGLITAASLEEILAASKGKGAARPSSRGRGSGSTGRSRGSTSARS